MSDFDTTDLLADWDDILSRAGSVTAVTGGVTFSGVWAPRINELAIDDQLRDEKRYVVFTTFTQLSAAPAVRQTVVRSGVTYVVEAVRPDAEAVGMEFDVKTVL